MRIEFDLAKRDRTLSERGLDFADAGKVSAGLNETSEDVRFVYPEPRFVTKGWLDARLVVVVWTPVGSGRRVISMRKANDREQRRSPTRLDRP